MQPWEEFKRKYPSGGMTYSIDGKYRGIIEINLLDVLCGYVILPENHPYIGLSFYDVECDENPLYDLDVHGGITFVGYINGYGYAIGFDCAHAGDYVPSFNNYKYSLDVWRDEAFVIDELKRLTAQLRESEVH